jgi:hypothetical protein
MFFNKEPKLFFPCPREMWECSSAQVFGILYRRFHIGFEEVFGFPCDSCVSPFDSLGRGVHPLTLQPGDGGWPCAAGQHCNRCEDATGCGARAARGPDGFESWRGKRAAARHAVGCVPGPDGPASRLGPTRKRQPLRVRPGRLIQVGRCCP